jgi:hypothetical protein
MRRGRSVRGLVVLVGVLVGMLMGAAPAFAGAWWDLSVRAAPTFLAPGGEGVIDVAADDMGDTGITGAASEVTIKDVLPAGLTVTDAGAVNPHRARVGQGDAQERAADWKCRVVGQEVSCSTFLAIPPFERLEMEIPIQVQLPTGTTTALSDEASVTGGESEGEGGGGLAGRSLSRLLQVSGQPVAFGIEEGGYRIVPEDEGGGVDSQAGSHPFQLTSTVDFNEVLQEVQEPGEPVELEPASPAQTKDLSFSLPPGLLGNVQAVEECSASDFSAFDVGNLCPAGAAVGVAVVSLLEPSRAGHITLAVPVFNLEPAQGEPASFGFVADAVPVILDTAVRSGGDYGVTVSTSNTTAAAQILAAQITFWGEPDSESHDPSRGWACLRGGIERNPGETCETLKDRSGIPFLTLPTACSGQLNTSMQGDSWTDSQLQSQFTFENEAGEPLEALEGCAALPFAPSVTEEPEQPPEAGRPAEQVDAASTPTGLGVDVRVDQHGTVSEGALGDADVRGTTVTEPEGLLVNASAANGLQACSQAQAGYLGSAGVDPLAPGAPQPLRFSTEKAACPEASKLGSVRIKTPLLREELQGWVYLATPSPDGEPGLNPFNSLLALYIVAENPRLGIRVKAAGEGHLNEQTGQLTTSFQDTPQVPFEELKLQFFGGPRGSLSTPPACGSYASTSSFTAWSNATSSLSSQPPFQITTGTGGGACPPSPLSFAPSFQAGSTSLQAGAFSPFTLTINRPDGQQPLKSLSMHLPDGAAAVLAGLTPCPEPPAGEEWACGPGSLIGQSTATAGLGGEPVTLPGQAYLTVGYSGAPFGLLVVTPAVAGPFDLGNVDVRSKIIVNPTTAAVTIETDPFPTFVKGVPAQLKQVSVLVNRPQFTFNPTNCSPMNITGTLTGAENTSTPVSSPFQVTGCQNLPFAPKLTASAAGKGSKADGTTFDVTLESKGLGQANIAKVDLQLPKALSSRLPTLQKACVAPVFNANPAGCGEDSIIGTATIHTPVLNSPLTGPAYLVSHGAQEFPDVEFVLQGEGISLILDGKTDIKHGITYSRFEAAPDAPFTRFETSLPAGPHSILTPNVPENENFSLCKTSLSMPAEITSQAGTTIKQAIPIAVTGCKAVAAYKTSRAQHLTKALKACRRKNKHNKHKRAKCEKQAHKQYPTKPHNKTTL